jgi:hypothetical protein
LRQPDGRRDVVGVRHAPSELEPADFDYFEYHERDHRLRLAL